MSVSTISTAAGYTGTSTTGSRSNVDTNQFLGMLVAQMQNQNPLDPTDSSTFMSQMMSYANYSELATMNSSLDGVLTSMSSLLATSALGFIGRTVEAKGDTAMLENGSAKWGYALDGEAKSVTLTVKDADGNVVWQGSGETSSGSHTFSWDGKGTDGKELPEGAYTLEVEAKDANGKAVDVSTTVFGKVTGIDSSDGSMVLKIGEVSVTFDAIVGILS
jgi:flagellar basal-body rod modification protein FlgD